MLKRLFLYLIETQAFEPPKPKPIKKRYSWILEPYLRYLRDECELSETTIQRACRQVGSFLEALRQKAGRTRFKALSAESVESYIKQHLKSSPENLASLTGSLRKFLSILRFSPVYAHRFFGFAACGPILSPCVATQRHGGLRTGTRA
jgi:Phage integrase, N-terminal SAM-like domain